MRTLGVLLFLATLAMPVHGCLAHPRDFEPARASATGVHDARATPRAPRPGYEVLARRLRSGWWEDGAWGALWNARAWYPYLLIPFWVGALALRRRGGRPARAGAVGILALSVAIAAFEARYLFADYGGFLGPAFQDAETVVVWLLVCGVLFWRPRRFEDPIGAALSAQALLGVLHALTFPVQDLRLWTQGGHGVGAMLAAIGTNYRIGFWLAVAGLAITALPGYVPALLRRPQRGPAEAATSDPSGDRTVAALAADD